MADEEKANGAEEVAGWLFAQDLSAYAGEWVAARPREIVAHGVTLQAVREAVLRLPNHEGVRYYAVPGEIQAT